jgi:hypothetical protein
LVSPGDEARRKQEEKKAGWRFLSPLAMRHV